MQQRSVYSSVHLFSLTLEGAVTFCIFLTTRFVLNIMLWYIPNNTSLGYLLELVQSHYTSCYCRATIDLRFSNIYWKVEVSEQNCDPFLNPSVKLNYSRRMNFSLFKVSTLLHKDKTMLPTCVQFCLCLSHFLSSCNHANICKCKIHEFRSFY